MRYSRYFGSSTPAMMSALLMAVSMNVSANNTWSYHQESDRLTNQTYSFAQSPLPRRGLYDYLRLEIVCKENKLQAVIIANDLIASQNSGFEMEYQVDKKPPATVPMKTFPDSKREGYTIESARRIADDLLAGQAVFISIKTMIKKVLSSSIPLDKAAEPIQHVFADCGLGSSGNGAQEAAYSLAEFEQEFSQLSPEQQQKLLATIKKLMREIR